MSSKARARQVREWVEANHPDLYASAVPADDPLLLRSLALTPRQRLRQATALLRSLERFDRVSPEDS